ncbi:MAG: hypothetical protein ACSLFD_12745 [Solirubrobacterales bacterium]
MGIPGEPPVSEASAFPAPGDPRYDPFAKVGSKSELTIADIDRLAGYFTGDDVTREALIAALSQATQNEAERALEVVDNYDESDNDEVTVLLNKYGLSTNEVPVDQLGRIGEKNDLTVQEFTAVRLDFYPEIPYDDIRDALAEFTQDEIDIARDVLGGTASRRVLDNLMRSHGILLRL